MSDLFWTTKGRYGLIYKSKSQNEQSVNGCLIVFVHGMFGDCLLTWRQMPQWVLEQAGVDVDMVSFDYPSKLLQRASIQQAANDLQTWLETSLGHYRHLVFVTHSTGGLVVKQVLNDSFVTVRDLSESEKLNYEESTSVWLRTRHVINVAVPHSGGSPFATYLGGFIYQMLFYPVVGPLLRMIRFFSQGKLDWGRNEIIRQLRWQNPWLLELEKRFVEDQRRSEALDLPSPRVHDIYAKSDLSVPVSSDPTQREIYIRGTHKSIKVPNRPSAPIIGIVSEFVRQYATEFSFAVVDRIMGRIHAINQATAAECLVGKELATCSQDPDRPVPVIAANSYGTQAEVLDMILASIRSKSKRPRQMVLTGVSGMGKSMVMRILTWRLGRSYLTEPNSDNPMPIYIPLRQVSAMGNSGVFCYSWDGLWRWWREWVQSIYPEVNCSQEWLDKQFRTRPVTIILSGVDDFLLNHPSIGLSVFVNMLREATQRYSNNSRLTIVVSIRSSFHGVQRLSSDPRYIFEILRLSISQAKQAYPHCKEWLDDIKDKEMLDLMLSPLILSNYEPVTGRLIEGKPLPVTMIMSQTLATIMSRSHLVGVQTSSGATIENEHLELAVSLIAWLFFYKSRAEISPEVLCKEARTFRERWEKFFDEFNASSDSIYNNLETEVQDILDAFRLVEDPETCNALLQRTVFVPTGPNMVRFAHRTWQEFCLAHYFVLCIKSYNFAELGVAAFHSRIYQRAEAAFSGKIITEDCIYTFLMTWKKTHNMYIPGNMIGFLTWTKTAIEAQALHLLLNELPNFEVLSRMVLIGGLGHRVLLNSPDDYSLDDLRRGLFPVLQKFANPGTAPADDPVACSLAWFYQRAFAESFGLEQPGTAWPAIGFDNDSETIKALSMICTARNGDLVLDARSRSLQQAFLALILETFRDPNLLIRALHYIYYLVVARKHGVHVVELSQELPQLLAPGSDFEKLVESFELVPEALTLYRKCQEFHNQLEPGFAFCAVGSW